MIAIATFFSGLGGHLVLAFLVISGFLISLGIFYLQTRRIGKQILRGLSLIEQHSGSQELRKESDPVQRILLRKIQFAKNWSIFRQGMEQPDMHYFGAVWAEFVKHLRLPSQDSGQQAIRTSADPAIYFNERTLYFVNINSRLFDAIPGFLTGGGIFGTFVGLVAGIYLAQDGMSAGPTEMKQAMKFLMGGVSTAFITSIFGIGLSILFSIIEKRRQHWIGGLVHHFCEQLEACFEIQHQEDSAMSRLHIAQMEQVAELKKLTRLLQAKTVGQEQSASTAVEVENRIGASLAPAIGKMFETLVRYQDNQRASQQQAMQGALAPLFEQFQTTLGQKLSAIELGLFALNDNLRNQNEGMGELWRDLRASGQEGLLNTARSIREAFDDFGVQFTTLMRESSAGSLNSLNQAMSQLTEALGAIHIAQDAHLRTISDGLNQYQGELRGVGDRQNQTLAQLLSGLHGATDQGNQKIEQLLSGLHGAADQGNQKIEQLISGMHGVTDQSSQKLEQLVSGLNKNLSVQNERLTRFTQDAAQILSDLKNRGDVQSATSQQATANQEAVIHHLLANLADVATGMRSSQVELAAALKDSSTGMSSRLERVLADLADVAAGMRGAQTDMSALLKDSSAGLAGTMHRTIADLGVVAAGMKSAQTELVTLLRESANSFSGQMGNSLQDMAQSSTAMLAVQTEMQRIFGAAPHLLSATEKLLNGMERFQESIGSKLDTAVTAAKPRETTQSGVQEKLILEQMTNYMDQTRDALQEESKTISETMLMAGGLLLRASESLEQTAAGMASHFAASLNQLSSQHSTAASTLRQASDQVSGRIEESISTMLLTMEEMRYAVEGMMQHANKRESVAQRSDTAMHLDQQRLEELLIGILHFIERLESNNQSTTISLDQHNQTITAALHNSREQYSQGNAELQSLVGVAASSLVQAVGEINHALTRLNVTMQQQPARLADENRQALSKIVTASNNFDPEGGRFGHLVEAMESGAMMIAVAGEKLQTSSDKLESVSTSLTATQETARQTLAGIGKAHEQLRLLLTNYEARFEKVDDTLGRTFSHLNNGLQEFSDKVLHFIAQIDEHMGGISEKLGYSVGDLGSKLDDMNDTLSGFLENLSSTLLKPLIESSRQVTQAGQKIHVAMTTLQQLSHDLKNTESMTNHEVGQNLAALAVTQERLKSTMATMQQQLHTSWNDHQRKIDHVTENMALTFGALNGDLKNFSSEKILEFIGGVDEHMDQMSHQLRGTIDELNEKLEKMNDTMHYYIQTNPDQK
ncbi:MAG: hypothetical protein HQL95_10505 [Magnetococcales bacterium]|nr:hypothetical protein [Magnetococcales bacterium]